MEKNNMFLLLSLLISTFFMGIGFASINSITGEINVQSTANVQSGVFITNVEYVSDINADSNSSKIKYYIGTMMQSTISLSSTDVASEIKYAVTFYNNSDITYRIFRNII